MFDQPKSRKDPEALHLLSQRTRFECRLGSNRSPENPYHRLADRSSISEALHCLRARHSIAGAATRGGHHYGQYTYAPSIRACPFMSCLPR